MNLVLKSTPRVTVEWVVEIYELRWNGMGMGENGNGLDFVGFGL